MKRLCLPLVLSLDKPERMVGIDATDKSATTKVEIEWNNRLYTDYMLLSKVGGVANCE